MVDQTNVRVCIEKAEETRVSASTKRHDLLRRGRMREEEVGDEEIDRGCADVGTCICQ